MQRPTVVFPDPDSPTSPSVSPLEIAKVTPSTALTSATTRASTPRLTGKYFRRSRTTSSGSPTPTGSFGVVCGADCSITSGITVVNFEFRISNEEVPPPGKTLNSSFEIRNSSFDPLRIRQIPMQVTPRVMPFANDHPRGLVAKADGHDVGTSRIKFASRRKRGQRRHHALDRGQS